MSEMMICCNNLSYPVGCQNSTTVQGGPKQWHPYGFQAYSLVRCIILAIFVHSRVIFVEWRRSSSSADANKFCLYANKW